MGAYLIPVFLKITGIPYGLIQKRIAFVFLSLPFRNQTHEETVEFPPESRRNNQEKEDCQKETVHMLHFPLLAGERVALKELGDLMAQVLRRCDECDHENGNDYGKSQGIHVFPPFATPRIIPEKLEVKAWIFWLLELSSLKYYDFVNVRIARFPL